MTKQELALEVIRRLKAEYPLADCTLDYEHAWQLLVEVRLAAQCTDARVNIVVRDLFAKYPSLDALAQASPEEIEAIVRPCGLGRSKARGISACMRMLRDEFGGHVPDTMEQLLRLPGVGRKSANLVMAVSVAVSALVALVLSFSGGLASLALPAAVLYQLAWAVPALALPLTRSY